MNEIGSYLKRIRNEHHLSLKDVYERCGITDSKLSRMERGEGEPLNPLELKKLAQVYEISIISIYIKAGYLNKSDLSDYQFVFKNAALLSEDEKQSVQTQIDLFTKGRKAGIQNEL